MDHFIHLASAGSLHPSHSSPYGDYDDDERPLASVSITSGGPCGFPLLSFKASRLGAASSVSSGILRRALGVPRGEICGMLDAVTFLGRRLRAASADGSHQRPGRDAS